MQALIHSASQKRVLLVVYCVNPNESAGVGPSGSDPSFSRLGCNVALVTGYFADITERLFSKPTPVSKFHPGQLLSRFLPNAVAVALRIVVNVFFPASVHLRLRRCRFTKEL